MKRMGASLWSALALAALSTGVFTQQQNGTQQLSEQVSFASDRARRRGL